MTCQNSEDSAKGYMDIGFAKIDTDRRRRRGGFGETIYGRGKTKEQLLTIFRALGEQSVRPILATRCTREQADFLMENGWPDAEFDSVSCTIIWKPKGHVFPQKGLVAICTGGTSDISIAEEAAKTAEFFGAEVIRVYDVGVAGLHRLLDRIEDIRRANAIVAAAGMDGALASVIAGLVDSPVIALPTSVGYGASFGGLAPLLTMLNSCAEGVSVVNIDNGFGAGYMAAQINRKITAGKGGPNAI